MKKIIIVLIGISYFLLFMSNNQASSNTSDPLHNLDINEEIIVNVEPSWELKALIDDFFIFFVEGQCLIYKEGQIIKSIDGAYIAHQSDQTSIFLLVIVEDTKQLVRFSRLNGQVIKEDIMFNASSIVLYEDEVWLVGEKNGDAYINKLTKELKSYLSYRYGGLGYEAFVDVLMYQDKLFFIGLKDAHSQNSVFLNVGSSGERKYFISEIDNKGVIKKTVYFNLGTGTDSLVSFNNMTNLQLILQNDQLIEGYLLNEQLQLLNKTSVDKQEIGLDITEKWSYLYSQSGYLLGINRQTIAVDNKVLPINLQGEIKEVVADNSGLIVYTLDQYQLRRYLINEYHVNKVDPIVVSKNNDVDLETDLSDSPYFDIVSYMTDVKIYVESIEPFFNKIISGIYEGTFRIERVGQPSVLFNNTITVDAYDNLNNGYIYPAGYMLSFFGYAKVNGQTVFNGHILNNEGDYQVEFTNVNGESYTRFIRIIDNYYRSLNINEGYDIIVQNNEKPVLKLTGHNLSEIVVTDEHEQLVNYQLSQNNNDYLITLPSSNVYGIKSYQISALSNDGVITTNIKLSTRILTLKKAPIVYLKEKSSKECQIESLFNDSDQTIVNIKVQYDNQPNQLISSDLKNGTLIYSGIVNQSVKASIILEYDLGDGVLKTEELYTFTFTSKKQNLAIGQFGFEYLKDASQNEVLSSMTLTINIEDNAFLMSELKLMHQNIANKYAKPNLRLELFISISVSVLVLSGAFWYLKHLKKHKALQKLGYFVEKNE